MSETAEKKATKAVKPFSTELSILLNRFSREHCSNTPDFILAEYIEGCLNVYEDTIIKREKWHKSK